MLSKGEENMNIEFKYKLGAKARDKVTGYTGVINAVSRWLNGCNRYVVQAPVDKDGKIPDGHTFDEENLEILEEEVIKDKPVKTGGPTTKAERY